MDNQRKYRCGRRGPFIFLFILAGIFGLSAIVMFLWNEIMPSLVHASYISYWHAMGLLAMCRILFGGIKFGGRGYYRQRWNSKWQNMSPEEKAAMKEKMRERFGNYC
jgi:hypothetical protein